MQESYRFKVSGRVQGVGFRVATQRRALALGLRGWVRNLDDGSVEGCVSGLSSADLAAFRDWLAIGPPGARVDALAWACLTDSADVGESRFVVRRER